MDEKIYIVMFFNYSDWDVHGYFHNRDDAEKYCLAHPEEELSVKELPCFDNIDDGNYRDIQIQYTYRFVFNVSANEILFDEPSIETCQGEFLGSNYIDNGYNPDKYIGIIVNTADYDTNKAEKIAYDLYNRYMDFCERKPTLTKERKFNLLLKNEG